MDVFEFLFGGFCLLAGLNYFMAQRHKELIASLQMIEHSLMNIEDQSGTTLKERIAETLDKIRKEFLEYADQVTDNFAASIYSKDSAINLQRAVVLGDMVRHFNNKKYKQHCIARMDDLAHVMTWLSFDDAPPRFREYLMGLSKEEIKARFKRVLRPAR